MSGKHGVSEALFIHCGMTKEKWPCITVELMQGFLNDPSALDGEDEDFVDTFYKYFDWYWRNQD